jgi:hypothetical protein
MPAPLPLADLLALLRERELEIGVREHLTVGRLLARWDSTDTVALRDALAAVLARNPGEVAIVRAAFDELYRAPAAPPASDDREAPAPPSPQRPRRSRRRAFFAIGAVVALGLLLTALLWSRSEAPAVKVTKFNPPSTLPADGEETPLPLPLGVTWRQPDRGRSALAAAGLAGGLFLGLYRVRLRRAAESAARRRWHEELAERPGPQGYAIELGERAPPFPPAALEEAAGFLGRRAPAVPRHGDLDVDATLRRTLRAGLAPQVVFRARAAAPPLVVLEDIGPGMDAWRGRVTALLGGLAARNVPLDRWQFHADAGRVFRALGEPEISLRQLARLRAASPLLVVSAGDGVLVGREGRTAPWIEQLAAWPRRAWLHPAGDPNAWHPVLRRPDELKISVWPMTSEGLLAAARHLGHGRPGPAARATFRNAADRPVAPLDVDRLRWLLALCPRRDPELLESLRQRFCPHVPPAAMLEALEAPPLDAPLGLPPEAGEVHAFLADLLAASEPEAGTAAHDRWRLDRALQEIRIPGREERAVAELRDLASGPLAGQVGDAIAELTAAGGPLPRLPERVGLELRRTVLSPIRRRAAGTPLGGWRRAPLPGWAATAAALAVAFLAALALPALSNAFTREVPARQEERYTLKKVDASGTGPFRLEASGDARWRDIPKVLVGTRGEWRVEGWPGSLDRTDEDREASYYVRDAAPDGKGVLGISNYVSVGRRNTPPPPPLPVEPKASGYDPPPVTQQPQTDLRAPGTRSRGTRSIGTQPAPAVPPSAIPAGALARQRAARLSGVETKLDVLEKQLAPLPSEARDRYGDYGDLYDRVLRLRDDLSAAREKRSPDNSDLESLETEIENLSILGARLLREFRSAPATAAIPDEPVSCDTRGNEILPGYISVPAGASVELLVLSCLASGRLDVTLSQAAGQSTLAEQTIPPPSPLWITLPPLEKGKSQLSWAFVPTTTPWQLLIEISVNGAVQFRQLSGGTGVPSARAFMILLVE